MSATEIHCPSCGHHLFDADISAILPRAVTTEQRSGLLGSQTEIAMTLLEDFFDESSRVARDSSGRMLQAEFIDTFNAWAIERGSTPQSASALGRGLRELGVGQGKSNGQRFYLGVTISPSGS